MKKKLLVAILATTATFCCILGFTACGGGDEGHKHSYTDNVVPPTCTTDGYTEHTCDCGYSYRDNDLLRTAHTFDREVATEQYKSGDATCTQKAVYFKSCICGLIGTEMFEYGETEAHAFEQIPNERYLMSEADCIHKAVYYKSCRVCGAEDTETFEYGGLTDHNYEDRVCTVCKDRLPSEGLGYMLSDDESYYIVVEPGLCRDTDIVIASEYEGLPVKAIRQYTFSPNFNPGRLKITSIAIPDSITFIDRYAFRDCTNLKAVYITDVAAWCNIEFADMTSNPLYYTGNLYLNGELINELIIPDGVTEIRDGAFYHCYNITKVTLPDSITSIGNSAFERCTYLKSITIPDGVTTIEAGAFESCNSLESITIPDSITSIKTYSLSGCIGLKDINFKGTMEQWNTIEKDSGWQYMTGTYTVHCTNGDIAKSDDV